MAVQTQEMTFWDHLEDLRKSLFRVAGALVAVTVALFFFKDFLFEDFVLAPSKGDFFLYRLIGTDFALSLVNIEVAAQFMIHMKVTFLCALIVTLPYLIYELWRFILSFCPKQSTLSSTLRKKTTSTACLRVVAQVLCFRKCRVSMTLS